jgi:hypothetical protein
VPASSTSGLCSSSRWLLVHLLPLISFCCCRASSCAIQALQQHCVASIGQELRPQPLLLQTASAGASWRHVIFLSLHIRLIIAAVARRIRLQLTAAR